LVSDEKNAIYAIGAEPEKDRFSGSFKEQPKQNAKVLKKMLKN
jgi:hypothetical protein